MIASGSTNDPKVFRLRLIWGSPSNPRSEQCADLRVVSGQPFSDGAPQVGWSVSGTLTAVDAWPRFTGKVTVGTTSAQFDSAPFIDGLLQPRDVAFSGYIAFFYLAIERI